MTVLWFDGTTRELEIVSEATVRTLLSNPFDYLLTFPASARLPMTYPSREEAPLQHYRGDTAHCGVDRLAARISRKVGKDTLAFIGELNSMIYSKWKVAVREEGDPLPPEETLRRGEGSCRDLTVLFMAACRAVGIASRFTSGYQRGDPDQERRYMHAWPEVYLPGAGWRGYDPTQGLAVSDGHVALASGAQPLAASPTQGTFRGTGASAEMAVNLTIRTSP